VTTSIADEDGRVGANASRGYTRRSVAANFETILAALNGAATGKARYVMYAWDSSAINASGVRGQQRKAASTTAPQVLPDVNTLVVDTCNATPDAACAPAVGAGRVPPARITLGGLRAAVVEVAADAVAHGFGCIADTLGRVVGRSGRVSSETIFAGEVAGVGGVAVGDGVVRVVTSLVVPGSIYKGSERSSDCRITEEKDCSLGNEVSRDKYGEGRDAKAKVDPPENDTENGEIGIDVGTNIDQGTLLVLAQGIRLHGAREGGQSEDSGAEQTHCGKMFNLS